MFHVRSPLEFLPKPKHAGGTFVRLTRGQFVSMHRELLLGKCERSDNAAVHVSWILVSPLSIPCLTSIVFTRITIFSLPFLSAMSTPAFVSSGRGKFAALALLKGKSIDEAVLLSMHSCYYIATKVTLLIYVQES